MEMLHEHNQKTYENICRMYNEGIQRVAVVQPTGSGKSLLMQKLIEDNPDSRFFVLSTSHKINDQFKSKLEEDMLERVDFNIYYNMPNMKQETMESLQPDYIFLDEMHRALAKEWSKGIKVLLEMYPNAKVLGLSATPIRYLDRCRNVVEELFNGNLACDMSLSEAILDGILPMARYVCGVYSYQKDAESLNKKIEKSCNSEEEKKELLKELKVLKENLDKGNGVSDIFRKYVSGNEKFVVFLKDTKHLAAMKPVIEKWFIDAGFNIRLYEVHSKNIDRDKEFQAFREDTEEGIVKLCLSVAMLTEGIHSDVSGVIMLRETISPNMYFQMIGRAFACGKKTIPLIFDLVANSQFISDAADNFPNELRGEIEKRKEECEKEGKEYEVGFDVDEFIVMDYFMDVVSGFKAIEERLKGNWDLYIKALEQFKEREGDCNVTKRHIEVVDGVNVSLGQWISDMRMTNIGSKNYLLSKERKNQLDRLGFIWDADKYNFINKCRNISEYYKERKRYPTSSSQDLVIKRLGEFINREKKKIREEKSFYPEWKIKIIKKYLPNFSCEYESDKLFNKFIYYAELYKKRYGHIEIKNTDIIEGFPIGSRLKNVKKLYEKKLLSANEISIMNNLGLNLKIKHRVTFDEKINLAEEAVKEGIIISSNNRSYKGINFYDWLMGVIKNKYRNEVLKKREIYIIERLIGKSLYKLYNNGNFVKIVDKIEDRKIAICRTQKEAATILQEKYNIRATENIVTNFLNGKVTTPYKGRFMFYYATDEEIKRYLEENEAS